MSHADSTELRPLISCLMVTRERLAMARRAIDCFAAQDYGRRELVIVSDGHQEADALRAYAARRCLSGVTTTSVPRDSMPLGALRNRAVSLAQGDIICTWDDDDLSHPRRLSIQFEHMRREGARVSFMTDQLQYILRTRSLYWCDWTRPRGRPLALPTIPNTMMCDKRVLPGYVEAGPLSRRSGDAHVMRSLLKSGPVAELSGAGWLYVYVSHGRNVWRESHHLEIVRATGMTSDDLLRHRQELRGALAAYAFEPGVVVRDYRDAPVFTLPTFSPCFSTTTQRKPM